MLVLGRKEGESILIEGGIRIVVVACDKGGVRLGIQAPSSLRILRGEIADQVARETQRATVSAGATVPAGLAPAGLVAPVRRADPNVAVTAESDA
jgi:carbon storage regulator